MGKNNPEKRRLLRHQMSTLCKEDNFCASCMLPCRESLYEYELCAHTLCKDSADPTHCRESCVFIEQIATKKPGQCPAQKPITPTSECSAFCDNDSDCSEIEKCCSVGCSRTCLTPVLNETRILPQPEGITVHERKRKRSAILRWVMKRLSPQHTATNSNLFLLFVIQWRWSVHRQPETMTPWQTVMVRNKMYAILKHLLAPGRFYIFRVAAVNMHGSYGFSRPSHPAFKLSKEVKAPSAPVNLTVAYENYPPKIAWNPPNSELPLKEYRLTWWQTSDELAKAFEFRQRRHSNDQKNMDEDYEGGFGEIDEDQDLRKRSVVLPSYSTKADLDGLEAGHFYMVELYASVESSEGDLRGDPAILLIRAPNKTTMNKVISSDNVVIMPTSEVLSDDIDETEEKHHDDKLSQPAGNSMVELKTPYFESGKLKTTISWFSHPSCLKHHEQQENAAKFRVTIRSTGRCVNEMPPQQFPVSSCAATLENLQFRCDYTVGVERLGRDGKTTIEETIAHLTFSTLSCEKTPSDVPLKCEAYGVKSRAEAQRMEISMNFRLEVPTDPMGQQSEHTTTSRTATPTTFVVDRWRRREEEEEEEWLPIEEIDEQWKQEKIATPEGNANKSQQQQSSKPRESGSSQQQQQHQLNCFATSVDTAECSWNWPAQLEQRHNPLIGFRTVLASTLPGSPSNVIILDAHQRRTHLTGLNPKAVYRFRLQAVTAHGLGAELVEHFSTGHLAYGHEAGGGGKQKNNGDNTEMANNPDITVHVDQFPNTVELPWGSSASEKVLKFMPKLLLFLALTFSIFFSGPNIFR